MKFKELEKDILAFIHQKSESFAPFMVQENSRIEFYRDDAQKILEKKEEEGEDITPFEDCWHCFTVKFSENNDYIYFSGFGKSQIEAITNAHDGMLKMMISLQDEYISSTTRNNEIKSATEYQH